MDWHTFRVRQTGVLRVAIHRNGRALEAQARGHPLHQHPTISFPSAQYAESMTGPVNPIPESHNLDPEPIWSGMGPSAEMEATGIQSLLAAAGIDAIVNGFSQIPSVPFEVLVTQENVARAKQVLAEALASGAEAAEEGERQSEIP